MAEQSDQGDAPEELKESAAELGVDDVEGKDADEIVEDAQRAQGDSQSSPSNPDWEEDGPRDDVAGDPA